jgi:hypothetical protein
MAALPDQDTG